MAKRESRDKWIWALVVAGLVALAAISSVRGLIIGLDRDEEYAVALAYRLAVGDIPFREMWEPHQTSVLIPALLVKLFLVFQKDGTYLLLFLRMAGIVMQLCVCVLWYDTVKKFFGAKPALFTAFVLFLTLPKWMTTPEFANQQIWFLVLVILFLLRYEDDGKTRNCILAGLAMSMEVLVYPSCVLLFVPYFVWLFRKKRRDAFLFMAVCVACAAVFFGYLVVRVAPGNLFRYLGYVAADPQHDRGIWEKLAAYGFESLEILLRVAIYVGIAAAVTLLIAKITKVFYKKARYFRLFCFVALLVAMADQVRLWAFEQVPTVHPQIHYLLLFALGGFLYRGVNPESRTRWKSFFWLAWMPSILAFLAVLALTNLDMKASFVHLLPGMLCSILFWCGSFVRSEEGGQSAESEESGQFAGSEGDEQSVGNLASFLLPILWIVLLAGSHTILLRMNEGLPGTVFSVKQKALYGAAKNVYCTYMTGYQYNSDYQFLNAELKSDERVLYIGENMLIYLMTDMEICGASVISTPVYNERYLEYFEVNSQKIPTAIVIDKDYWDFKGAELGTVSKWVRENYDWDGKSESEFLWIVKK